MLVNEDKLPAASAKRASFGVGAWYGSEDAEWSFRLALSPAGVRWVVGLVRWTLPLTATVTALASLGALLSTT